MTVKIVGYTEIKDVFGMVIGVIPIIEEIVEVIEEKQPKKNGKKKDK